MLEAVQWKAAKFVNKNYDYIASVTEMLQNPGWDYFATRRLLG